ncbi:MAG: response regulator [Planctomycetota bacterium]|jgi:CheY-like chemotaxis protein
MIDNLSPILLIEDDKADVVTVKRAFGELKIENPLVCMAGGKEALEYLQNGKNRKPCVIFLDLIMPGMNGIEFLKIIKSDDVLKTIPVIVLTISQEQQDKIESFKLGIAGYIVKPDDYDDFVRAIETINIYWTFSELPNVK